MNTQRLVSIVSAMTVALAGCALFGAAIDVSSYDRELDGCLKEGRAAHSLSVYEACAHEVDIKHGVGDAGKDR